MTSCSMKLRHSKPATDEDEIETGTSTDTSTPQTAATGNWKCPSCGAENEDYRSFCDGCGDKRPGAKVASKGIDMASLLGASESSDDTTAKLGPSRIALLLGLRQHTSVISHQNQGQHRLRRLPHHNHREKPRERGGNSRPGSVTEARLAQLQWQQAHAEGPGKPQRHLPLRWQRVPASQR